MLLQAGARVTADHREPRAAIMGGNVAIVKALIRQCGPLGGVYDTDGGLCWIFGRDWDEAQVFELLRVLLEDSGADPVSHESLLLFPMKLMVPQKCAEGHGSHP